MTRRNKHAGSILMLSIHGYVDGEPELGKPDTGGQVVFVLELAKRFARLGYHVDLVTRRFEGQRRVDRVIEGLRVLRIPFGGSGFIRKEDMHDHLGDFVTSFLHTVKSRQLDYDVVSSHYWDAGWAGQKIAEELNIPHIHTPHSIGAWKRQQMSGTAEKMEATYRFEERIRKEFLVYRSCDHIVATTREQTELLKKHYDLNDRNITVIPPGIDENRFVPLPRDRVKSARERFGMSEKTIYAVGRMARNKGYDLLIRSFGATRQIVPDAKLLLAVGAGEDDQDERKVAELRKVASEVGVADDVIYAGYVPDEDMADRYRAAGVFALSSRYEPFGMTAIEAMACGTPTVVTVHGGLHEIISFGRNCLYSDPLHPEEFGAVLALPLRYPRLAEDLSIEGSRFARRSFGWTGIAKRTLEVFDRFKGKYATTAGEARKGF
ncbi:MAG TPA: glycosyltransferase [Rhodothermales bacterium]|nr:glycosyltransferase [Rhodothermales bacterium]